MSKLERKYQTVEARVEVVNRLLMIELILYYIVAVSLNLYELVNREKGILPIFVVGMSVLFLPVTIFVFRKYKRSIAFCYLPLILFFIEFFIVLVLEDKQYTLFIPIVILSSLVLLYNKKIISIFSILAAIIGIANRISQITVNNSPQENITLSVTLTIFLLAIFGIYRTTIRGKQFNDDIIGTIKDEQEKQKEILEEVLHIAEVIKKNADSSKELVNKLGESTDITAATVHEISLGTQATAVSIQNQTRMTHEIKVSLDENVDISNTMVEKAKEASASVDDTLVVMKNLKEHSKDIANTNTEVEKSMHNLLERTGSVQQIADIITSISQ